MAEFHLIRRSMLRKDGESRSTLCCSADGEKAVDRQRALLLRALRRSIPHVTDFVEHHFEMSL